MIGIRSPYHSLTGCECKRLCLHQQSDPTAKRYCHHNHIGQGEGYALAVEFQLLEELLIARIGAKLVIARIDAQVEYIMVRFVDGFLEPLEGGIAVASRSVIGRNEGWRNVLSFGLLDLAGRSEAEESLWASALPELESLAHPLSPGAIGGGIGPGLPLFLRCFGIAGLIKRPGHQVVLVRVRRIEVKGVSVLTNGVVIAVRIT